MASDDTEETILIVPPDVDLAALGKHVLEGGPVPDRCRVRSLAEWMADGRVEDCDCGLLQCECVVIRQHEEGCSFRLTITSPVDVGPMECDCR